MNTFEMFMFLNFIYQYLKLKHSKEYQPVSNVRFHDIDVVIVLESHSDGEDEIQYVHDC